MSAQTTVSKFSIVRKISELLNLGNGGKLDSFISRVVKVLNKETLALKKNLDVLKFNYEQALDELKDKLEDANNALEESYLNVDVDKIDTNEKQTQYVDTYLNNIDEHLLKVKDIEKRNIKLSENFERDSKEIQDQIDSLNKRIKSISEE